MTANCVICDLEAVCWSGHVHTEHGSTIAGKCEKHRNAVSFKCDNSSHSSCYGTYFNKPLREENFNSIINENENNTITP